VKKATTQYEYKAGKTIKILGNEVISTCVNVTLWLDARCSVGGCVFIEMISTVS